MCPNPRCHHRVEQGQRRCTNCGIRLVPGRTQTIAGATYAVMATSRSDPRLFLLILVIGIVALLASRRMPVIRDVVTQLNHLLHRAG